MLTAAWIGMAIQVFSFVLSVLRIKILSDYFSVDNFGLISIYFSVISFFSIIIIFNADRYIFRVSVESGKAAIASLPSLMLLSVIFGPISAIYFHLDSKFTGYVFLATVNVVIISWIHLFRFYFLGMGGSVKYTMLSFLMTNLWFIVLIGLILNGTDLSLYGTLGLMLISHVLLLVVSIYLAGGFCVFKNFSNKSVGHLQEAIKYSIGFLPIIISTRILELGDKYIVHALLSGRDMGILIMANSIVAAVIAIISVLSDLYRPYFSGSKTIEQSMQISRKFIAVGFIVIFCSFLVFFSYGELLFRVLLAREFSSAVPLAVALLPSCFIVFLTQFYINILEKEKKSYIIGRSYIIGSILFLLLTIPLVSHLGVWGAVVATYIGNIVIFILLANSHWWYISSAIKELLLMCVAAIMLILLIMVCGEIVKAVVVGLMILTSIFMVHLLFKRTAEII